MGFVSPRSTRSRSGEHKIVSNPIDKRISRGDTRGLKWNLGLTSASRHVPDAAAFANANRNPEAEQRVRALGGVATDVSWNVTCSKVGTYGAWVMRS